VHYCGGENLFLGGLGEESTRNCRKTEALVWRRENLIALDDAKDCSWKKSRPSNLLIHFIFSLDARLQLARPQETR
jgi:hypothetical protein